MCLFLTAFYSILEIIFHLELGKKKFKWARGHIWGLALHRNGGHDC